MSTSTPDAPVTDLRATELRLDPARAAITGPWRTVARLGNALMAGTIEPTDLAADGAPGAERLLAAIAACLRHETWRAVLERRGAPRHVRLHARGDLALLVVPGPRDEGALALVTTDRLPDVLLRLAGTRPETAPPAAAVEPCALSVGDTGRLLGGGPPPARLDDGQRDALRAGSRDVRAHWRLEAVRGACPAPDSAAGPDGRADDPVGRTPQREAPAATAEDPAGPPGSADRAEPPPVRVVEVVATGSGWWLLRPEADAVSWSPTVPHEVLAAIGRALAEVDDPAGDR